MLARLCARAFRRYVGHHESLLSQQHSRFRLGNTVNTQALRFNASVSTTPAGSRNEQLGFPPDISQERATSKHAAPRQIHDETAVNVKIDGVVHRFSAILLRDLCSCPLCIDQSTRQKLFATADIPLNIRATSCSTNSETAVVSWNIDVTGYGRDHKTEIPLYTLRNIVQYGKPVHLIGSESRLLPREYWNSEMYSSQCSDFDYEAYMHDDKVLLAALHQIHTHGLLFVTSVPEDERSVETIAERIGPLKTTFYGRTWDVRSVPKAKNVAYTSQNLGFHMDLLYMEQPPHIQLLHCIRSSSAGGASLFADSFRAVRDLCNRNPDEFRTLSEVKAAYHYDHPESQYYHQFRSVVEHGSKYSEHFVASSSEQADPMDSVSSVAWSPPFQAPFALTRGVTANQSEGVFDRQPENEVLGQDIRRWHQAAQKFNYIIHQPENIYERLMKPGECVIFDNRRVLHARKAFEVGDAGKERWLRGAYIDKDPYMSKLRILNQQN